MTFKKVTFVAGLLQWIALDFTMLMIQYWVQSCYFQQHIPLFCLHDMHRAQKDSISLQPLLSVMGHSYTQTHKLGKWQLLFIVSEIWLYSPVLKDSESVQHTTWQGKVEKSSTSCKCPLMQCEQQPVRANSARFDSCRNRVVYCSTLLCEITKGKKGRNKTRNKREKSETLMIRVIIKVSDFSTTCI